MDAGNGNNRDSVRKAIFSSPRRAQISEQFMFFGALVELRQPTLNDIMHTEAEFDVDPLTGEVVPKSNREELLNAFIKHLYVPGTDEKVFDESDRDELRSFPFNSDVARFNMALTRLMSLNEEQEVKN